MYLDHPRPAHRIHRRSHPAARRLRSGDEMSKPDGGPAFPIGDMHGEGGMSLRDYFAAAALQGVMSNPECRVNNAPLIAADVYLMADAMLAERQK